MLEAFIVQWVEQRRLEVQHELRSYIKATAKPCPNVWTQHSLKNCCIQIQKVNTPTRTGYQAFQKGKAISPVVYI